MLCHWSGQPLGYYSSWPLFALSHHVLVWYAAEQCYPGQVFRRYAILGDDIVIADEAVAAAYSSILSAQNVAPKSIISRNGNGEFAKRYWSKSMQVDLSPISLRALWNCRSLVGITRLASHYKIESMSVLFRLAGAGWL